MLKVRHGGDRTRSADRQSPRLPRHSDRVRTTSGGSNCARSRAQRGRYRFLFADRSGDPCVGCDKREPDLERQPGFVGKRPGGRGQDSFSELRDGARGARGDEKRPARAHQARARSAPQSIRPRAADVRVARTRDRRGDAGAMLWRRLHGGEALGVAFELRPIASGYARSSSRSISARPTPPHGTGILRSSRARPRAAAMSPSTCTSPRGAGRRQARWRSKLRRLTAGSGCWPRSRGRAA
jgi:hypothetical protein